LFGFLLSNHHIDLPLIYMYIGVFLNFTSK
jgi:hypothetical protein